VDIHSEGRVENVDQVELLKAKLKAKRRDYLREVLRATGLKSMSALAEKLGKTPPTLANIQNAERSASRELVEKIRQLAPQVEGAEILSAKAMAYSVEPSPETRPSIGQWLDQDYAGRMQKLEGSEEDRPANIEDIRRSFDAMDRDDVFVYVSAIEAPLEMDPNELKLKRAIANAIQRCASFLYLTPTKEYLQSVDNFVDISAQFARFKGQVLSNITGESVQAQCSQRLLLIQADASPLFTFPSFKWELFHSNTIDVPYKAAAGALIVSGLVPDVKGPKLRVPLGAIETRQVLLEIAKTICRINPNLPPPDRVPDDIVARLKESAELAKGKKIDRG
jgi:transcriptional regulator with XRE-family HTH domain